MPRVVIEGMSAEEVAELVRRLGGDVAITVTESAVGKTAAKTVKADAVRTGRKPKGKVRRVPFTIQLDPEARKILDVAAIQTGLSRSDVINKLLRMANDSDWVKRITDGG